MKIVALALGLFAAAWPAAKYTIALIPDTQHALEACPEVTAAQFRWIAAHKDSLNLKYVMHMGDMIQNGSVTGTNSAEWQRFDPLVKLLEDAGIPVILNIGNHDLDRLDPSRVSLFNSYFPKSRVEAALARTGYARWGGSFPEGSNTNSYHLFEEGGVKWLAMSLRFLAGGFDDVMAWANAVAARYADRQIMLITHSYLTHGGVRDPVEGEPIWKKLVDKVPNIPFVFCGHLSTTRGLDTNSLGKTVHQMLVDYQTPCSVNKLNNSITRFLEFDPDRRRVRAWTYSPPDDRHYTDGANAFAWEGVKAIAPDPAVAVVRMDGGSQRLRFGGDGRLHARRDAGGIHFSWEGADRPEEAGIRDARGRRVATLAVAGNEATWRPGPREKGLYTVAMRSQGRVATASLLIQ